MARTQAPDYEQRREAILDTAARLFAGSGFAGTSVSELAAACAMSKSLIYHYHPSKEDVLHAVMASHVDQLGEDVAVVMALDAAPPAKLDRLIHRFMDHYVGAADRQKVLLNELDSLPGARRAAIVDKQRKVVAALQELIVAVYPPLRDDPVRARARTMLVFGMINWTHTWFRPDGALSAADIADMVLDLVLPGGRAQAS